MNFKETVIRILNEYLKTQEIDARINEDTIIFGKEGLLDSMGIVNLIVDLESYYSEKGCEINLTSEKALSFNNSPFRSVSTLSSFIESQLK